MKALLLFVLALSPALSFACNSSRTYTCSQMPFAEKLSIIATEGACEKNSAIVSMNGKVVIDSEENIFTWREKKIYLKSSDGANRLTLSDVPSQYKQGLFTDGHSFVATMTGIVDGAAINRKTKCVHRFNPGDDYSE